MKRFNKIAIIGVGLIGGSIGLAIKKRKLAKEVIGVFRHRSTLLKALKCKAIDRGAMNVKDGVRDTDLIIIATPVSSIPPIAKEAARFSKPGALLTDVGSTKKWIVDRVENILAKSQSISFVGSHPMAGSEHTSVEFAIPDLLKGSPCIVTRTNRTDKRALAEIANFWKALGAKVAIMSPATHDRYVALVSHLPHLVAFSIAGAVSEKAIPYAAEGFRDTTRVASSDPLLWTDILMTNKREVMRSLAAFERFYKKIIKSLSKDDYRKVAALLGKAKAKRDKFFCAE